MARQKTIVVKGSGNVKVKPDQAEISFGMEAKDKDYDKAMELASMQVDKLKEALVKAGFDRK